MKVAICYLIFLISTINVLATDCVVGYYPSWMRDEFNKLMRPKPLFITMAVTAGHWFGQWLDYEKLKTYIDWFGCMTYDFHGDWTDHAGHNSPLYASGGDVDGCVDSGFRYLTERRRLPADKILLGVPFYGRGFYASELYGPSTGNGSEHQYRDIPALLYAGWTYHWDDVALVPYIINPEKTKLISYDDTLSVRLKAEYAIAKKVKGVMIWALGQDLVNGRQPLLEAASAPILNQSSVETGRENNPSVYELVTNYPNPFNAATTISIDMPDHQYISLTVSDVRGRLLANLFNGFAEKGRYTFSWTIGDLASGVYLCKLQSKTFSKVHKLTLLK